MGLSIMFVSGVRRSGKSAVIRLMIDRLWKSPPHYLRLAKVGGDKARPRSSAKPVAQCGVASARWVNYEEDRVFEVLPELLSGIHKQDRYGSVVIEADADPVLRHAYPYDHRVFVMPVPGAVRDLFRESRQAAVELQRALDDTAAFASEIFGLFADSSGDAEPHEDRPDLTATQVRGFLNTPLGDELATRIQLQPPYHGLVESDVIVVNSGVGRDTSETGLCLRRLGQLLARLRVDPARKADGASGRGSLIRCNPCALDQPETRQLMKALKPMCRGGK